jgi:predicted alpha/beta hydrolase family esterase
MTDPDLPVIAPWVRRVGELVGEPEQAGRTVLVGHSVGCQAVVRYLATAPADHVAGVLLVAAWWAVDQPWPAIQPWIETPIDLDRVRAAAPYFRVLLSSDDPFTGDQAANGGEWEEQLDARVTVVPNAGHFNGRQEPAVLRAVEEIISEHR